MKASEFNISQLLTPFIIQGVKDVFGHDISSDTLQFQKTRKEFIGDITLVVFPLVKLSKLGPEQTGEQLGAYLQANSPLVSGYQVVKGFLNVSIQQEQWIAFLQACLKISGMHLSVKMLQSWPLSSALQSMASVALRFLMLFPISARLWTTSHWFVPSRPISLIMRQPSCSSIQGAGFQDVQAWVPGLPMASVQKTRIFPGLWSFPRVRESAAVLPTGPVGSSLRRIPASACGIRESRC
jgi:hypothetical protein